MKDKNKIDDINEAFIEAITGDIILEYDLFEKGTLEFKESLEMFEWNINEDGHITVEFCNIGSSNFFYDLESIYPNAVNDFVEDIIIALLYEVMNKINDYFAIKPKHRRTQLIDKYHYLYHDYNTILDIINVSEPNKDTLEYIKFKFNDCYQLERQISKLTLPYSIFLILKTLYVNGPNLLNLGKRYLGLKPTRSKSGTEIEIFRNTYNDHCKFIGYLEKLDKYEPNISLTLLQYNLITNFLDTILQMKCIKNEFGKGQEEKLNFSEIPCLTWKNEMTKNKDFYEFMNDDIKIKKLNLLFSVAKQNLKNFIKEMLLSDRLEDNNLDNTELNFKINMSYYELFSHFNFSEKNLNTILEISSLNLMDQVWVDAYIKSYQRNYRKKR